MVFCENCRKDVDYIISTVPMKYKEYSYVGKEARCAECDSLIYIAEISDENLRTLNRERGI